MAKKKIIPMMISISLSIILIWILVKQIETKDLLQTFRHIYWPALMVFMAVSLLAAVLRSWRYKVLLIPHAITWKNILLVTFIRNLFVDLFPARIGSLSYIYLLNQRLQFSFEAATSTFIMALIFDFLTLSPFLILAVIMAGLDSLGISNSTLILTASFFFFFIALIFWKLIPILCLLSEAFNFFLKVFQLEAKKWSVLTLEKIQMTIESLKAIYKMKIYGRVLALSLVIRLAKYGSLYFLLLSLLHSHGFSLYNLSFFKTILGITGAELSSALPIKGLGGFGTWESAWAITFRLMNFDSQLAVISGIGVHLITNLFEYCLGIASIIFISLPFIKTKQAGFRKEAPR